MKADTNQIIEAATYIEPGFIPKQFIIPPDDYIDILALTFEWHRDSISRSQRYQLLTKGELRYDPLYYKLTECCAIFALCLIFDQNIPNHPSEYLGYDFIIKKHNLTIGFAPYEYTRITEARVVTKTPKIVVARPDIILPVTRQERMLRLAMGHVYTPGADFSLTPYMDCGNYFFPDNNTEVKTKSSGRSANLARELHTAPGLSYCGVREDLGNNGPYKGWSVENFVNTIIARRNFSKRATPCGTN